jgi:UDP-N-acetylmuramyl pentapeptide synthase
MAAAVDAVATVARRRSPTTILVARDSADAATVVREIVRPGDVLLVKGSRGVAMERVIESLHSDAR